MNKAKLLTTVLGGGLPAPVVSRTWDDQFTDTVAAGSVNGTTTTPGGQTRGAVDTTSKISVASGELTMTGVTASIGDDPRFYSTAITRAQGLAFSFDVTCITNFTDAIIWGWMKSQGTGVSRFASAVYLHSGSGTVNYWNGATATSISTDYTAGTKRRFVIILRSAGCYVVQVSADLTTYNLIHVATNDSTATLYVGGANRTAGATRKIDNMYVGQLGDGWASDAYSGASVPLAITGRDKQWLDALC